MAVEAIKQREGALIVANLDVFPGAKYADDGKGVIAIIDALIEHEQAEIFLENYTLLTDLLDEAGLVTENMQKGFANLMIEHGQAHLVLQDLVKPRRAASSETEVDEEPIEYAILSNLTEEYHFEAVISSVEKSRSSEALEYVDRLSGITRDHHYKVAETLISVGQGQRAMEAMFGSVPQDLGSTEYLLSGTEALDYRDGKLGRRESNLQAMEREIRKSDAPPPKILLDGVDKKDYFRLASGLIVTDGEVLEGNLNAWIDYNRFLQEAYEDIKKAAILAKEEAGMEAEKATKKAEKLETDETYAEEEAAIAKAEIANKIVDELGEDLQLSLILRAIRNGKNTATGINMAARIIMERQGELGGEAQGILDPNRKAFVVPQLGIKDRADWQPQIAEELISIRANSADVFSEHCVTVLPDLDGKEYGKLATKMVERGHSREVLYMIERVPQLQERKI